MTEEMIVKFGEGLDKLFDENIEFRQAISWEWNSKKEAIIAGLAEHTRWERDKQEHPTVIECLSSCIENLNEAAMVYYVSTK